MSDTLFEFYSRQYAMFSSEAAVAIRREVYGEDLGQTGWRDVREQARIGELLLAANASDVLDVACGSGGPSLALVQATSRRLIGVDIEQAGIEHARKLAAQRGLDRQARFEAADCDRPLPLEPDRFDAVVCIDAILHLNDRWAALADWARVLRPGGQVIFADAGVLTGPVTREEIDVRAMQGPFTLNSAGRERSRRRRRGSCASHQGRHHGIGGEHCRGTACGSGTPRGGSRSDRRLGLVLEATAVPGSDRGARVNRPLVEIFLCGGKAHELTTQVPNRLGMVLESPPQSNPRLQLWSP